MTLLFLRNIRTAVGPIAILLFGVLFTALPLVGFDQTINLFSLAGLAIAIGEIADATIVIVENCTAELSLHPAGQPRREAGDPDPIDRLGHQAAAVLAADHPRVVPAGVLSRRARGAAVRSAGLQQDVRDGVLDAADLFLLPIIVLWIFKQRHGWRAAIFARARRCGRIGRLCGP